MPQKSAQRHHKRNFILWNALPLLGAIFALPLIWGYLTHTLLMPMVLANMVSGFLVGSLLGVAQQSIGKRMQRQLLPYWISSSAIGGVFGGFVAGAAQIFLQGLSSATLPTAVPFIGVFAFIGLMQGDSLYCQNRRARYWPLLMTLLGAATIWANSIVVLIALVTIVIFAANRLEDWQLAPSETRALQRQPNIARLRLPENDEVPALNAVAAQYREQHSTR